MNELNEEEEGDEEEEEEEEKEASGQTDESPEIQKELCCQAMC